MGKERNSCSVLVRKPGGKEPLGRPGVDGRIILKFTLNKYNRILWSLFL
jgi:hypothetical protein